MKKLTAEGYCGKQHTLDELEACGECKKYRETYTEPKKEFELETVYFGPLATFIWNKAIEAAARTAIENSEGVEIAVKMGEEIRKLKK